MDDPLWNRLLAFDLDAPMSEYGFSTRLARENYWTKNFTAKAILEYKKFMYLAGTSDLMVSPSEVIDVVWHQHLTFTQSYAEFCAILGKQVQHVPSTRRKEDFEKFRSAKERTGKLYNKLFGEQPDEHARCDERCEKIFHQVKEIRTHILSQFWNSLIRFFAGIHQADHGCS